MSEFLPRPEGDQAEESQSVTAPSNKTPAATASNGKSLRQLRLYVTELLVAGAIGTGTWLFGEWMSSHGLDGLGSFFEFVAFVMFFSTVPISATKVWPRKRIIWIGFLIFCLVAALVFFLIPKPKPIPPPHPRFSFSFRMGDTRIDLTNSFLTLKDIGRFGSFPTGVLYIPSDNSETNVPLDLTVRNDAPDAAATDVQVTFSYDEKFTIIPEPYWAPARLDGFFTFPKEGLQTTNKLKTWVCYVPNTILPGNGFILPNLSLVKDATSSPVFVCVMARAKDAPASVVGFRIFVISKNSKAEPYVENRTNYTIGTFSPPVLLK